MTDILIERLEEEITRQRFNYKSLSVAAGLGETTVRDIITGRARNPRRDTLQKIARTLGLPLSHFLADETSVPLIDIRSSRGITEIAGVHEPGERPSGHERVEMPPEAGYRDLQGVRLRGDAFLPFLPEGTVLYYSGRSATGFDACLGKLCVMQLPGVALSVGILKRGTLYDRYDVMTYTARMQENTAIEWCAKVLFIKQI